MNWQRVTRAHRCPICDHDSWCCVADDLVLCMRSESARPSTGKAGGWLHSLGSRPSKPATVKPAMPVAPLRNGAELLERWSLATLDAQRNKLAAKLGVSVTALYRLGAQWAQAYEAWGFPMRDGHGNVCGIRLRKENAEKFAVTGSREGLFYDPAMSAPCVMVCEGPTDTAAAMTLGFAAVGRPSCMGAADKLRDLCRERRVGRLVIVADDDGPGRDGANMLCSTLLLPYKILALQQKDLRAFVQVGGTAKLLLTMLAAQKWNVPR